MFIIKDFIPRPTNVYKFVLKAMYGDANADETVEFLISENNPFLNQFIVDFCNTPLHIDGFINTTLEKWLVDDEANPSYIHENGKQPYIIEINWPYDEYADNYTNYRSRKITYFDEEGDEYEVEIS